MEMDQDDLDTILPTDNVGYQTKPYYITEHSSYQNTIAGEVITEYYFQGQHNGLTLAIEAAYDGNNGLYSMMKLIFQTMASLVGNSDKTMAGESIPKTAFGCFQSTSSTRRNISRLWHTMRLHNAVMNCPSCSSQPSLWTPLHSRRVTSWSVKKSG